MKHSIHCVCKGTNKVGEVYTSLSRGLIIAGIIEAPCPYGDLTVNQVLPLLDEVLPTQVSDFEGLF
jgi:hypothetical protein